MIPNFQLLGFFLQNKPPTIVQQPPPSNPPDHLVLVVHGVGSGLEEFDQKVKAFAGGVDGFFSRESASSVCIVYLGFWGTVLM